jgi:hypothetical protein
MNSLPSVTKFFLTVCLLLLACAFFIPGAAAITLTPGSTGSVATIAQGDPVTISGIATGHPQVGLQIWFIGYNFVKVTTVQVNNDDSYAYILRETDTANLAPGQYFVIIQHPMENGQFDIVYNAASGTVQNVQTGKTIFQFTGSGSLQSPNSVTALMNAIGSQNIDDTFATVTFFVSQPSVGIDSMGDVQQGTIFTLNGTTSLAAGDNLMVDITSSSFGPTAKTGSSGFSGASGMVTVQPGSTGQNTWSFTVDTSTFSPDEYLVTVSAVTQSATASGKFTVVPATTDCNSTGDTCPIPGLSSSNATVVGTATAVTANNTPAVTVTGETPPAAALPAATTKGAPLPASVCLVGIVAAVLLLRRRP